MGFLDLLSKIAAGAEVGAMIGEAVGDIAEVENGKAVGTLAGAAIATGAHLMDGRCEVIVGEVDNPEDYYNDYVIIDGKKIENIEW